MARKKAARKSGRRTNSSKHHRKKPWLPPEVVTLLTTAIVVAGSVISAKYGAGPGPQIVKPSPAHVTALPGTLSDRFGRLS
jgi:hypothetical protein